MNFRTALAAATILALPIAANAQAIDGIYIGGAAGINIMQPEHMTVTVPGAGTAGGDVNSGIGPAGVLSLGYGFGNGLRAEVEGDWRYNSFSGTKGGGSYGGKEQKYGVMVNALYDFVGVVDGVTPYVGVGVGYMEAQESGLHLTTPGGSGSVKTGEEGSFAYQAILGASMPLTAVPGLSLTADYRFMGMTGTRTYSGLSAGGVPAPAGSSVKATDDYNHTILIGLRYAFGAPAAAPAPMPAAAPVPAAAASRSYIVFFDWDKAVLTDRARSIVAEAAANSHKVQTTRIEVNGYTDTSGTAKYNMGLSVRRANAVAAELVKDGVPKSEIGIQGFGETHPLVPTGPNVREPQNRRVEIILK